MQNAVEEARRDADSHGSVMHICHTSHRDTSDSTPKRAATDKNSPPSEVEPVPPWNENGSDLRIFVS